MILNVQQLKRFFSNASTIKTNKVMQILEYIKIDNDKIIKTNLTAYVVMEITPTGETLLIDEKTLSAIVKATTADTITVTVKNNKGLLSDGVNNMSFLLSEEEH